MAVTSRHREIFDFIRQLIEARSHAPTISEVRARFGLTFPATAHRKLSVLEREGLIRRIPNINQGIETTVAPPEYKMIIIKPPTRVGIQGVVIGVIRKYEH